MILWGRRKSWSFPQNVFVNVFYGFVPGRFWVSWTEIHYNDDWASSFEYLTWIFHSNLLQKINLAGFAPFCSTKWEACNYALWRPDFPIAGYTKVVTLSTAVKTEKFSKTVEIGPQLCNNPSAPLKNRVFVWWRNFHTIFL